eukprot:5985139-Prymnesium_polylepis.1
MRCYISVLRLSRPQSAIFYELIGVKTFGWTPYGPAPAVCAHPLCADPPPTPLPCPERVPRGGLSRSVTVLRVRCTVT